MPASVFPGLSARGLSLNFGRNGVISIPSRAATPTIAGSFVGEGAAIPVRQGAFTATTLTPKKMAVISTFTREIANHSVPAIEGLIRDAIREDTSVAIDTVLLDNTAASAIRPAGLRNGVTALTGTAGGDFDAVRTDVLLMMGELVTATNGNLRSPVWIMNPARAMSLSMMANAGGDFPFALEISGGTLRGYPVIVSGTVTADRVFLVDAADFVSVSGDEPEFLVSDQATLHMEDTTPLAIGTAGTPNTVAAPVRSLFQTDTIGIRMVLPLNWAMRRAGVISITDTVTW
jgi:HK97 family phage major capsid protein